MKKVTFFAFLTVLLLQTVSVFAMTIPAAGSFAYDLYDTAIHFLPRTLWLSFH